MSKDYMFEKRDYIIQVSKMKRGENLYNLLVNKELFESFDCKEFEDVVCQVSIRGVKTERMIEFYFDFKGSMKVICSRCLADLVLPIDKKTQLYVKFGQEYLEPDVSEIIIPENQNDIDLSSYIYEELRLELPISPMHSSREECDKEMINWLSIQNTESKDEEKDFDPRWEKLKELINK